MIAKAIGPQNTVGAIGYHAENRRDRRQHDRTEPRAAGIDRCLPDILALVSFCFNLTDEDHRVLGDHTQ